MFGTQPLRAGLHAPHELFCQQEAAGPVGHAQTGHVAVVDLGVGLVFASGVGVSEERILFLGFDA